MPKVSKRRRFSREFKLKVIARMEGANVKALAEDLSIKREILYRWRDAFRRGGEPALRDESGRPTKAEAQEMALERGVAAKANDRSAPADRRA